MQAFKWIKETIGLVHIIINKAGLVKKSNLRKGWKAAFDVNVCIATRETIKDMRANNINGHIIYVNSVLAHKNTMFLPEMNVYAAT